MVKSIAVNPISAGVLENQNMLGGVTKKIVQKMIYYTFLKSP